MSSESPYDAPQTEPTAEQPHGEGAAEESGSFIQPRLSVWDGVSIIIGIVVGVSIFKVPGLICSNVAGPWETLGAWALGGVLSLCGALCYAELATTYPRSGGDYVYLTRAYGRATGFLFAWAQLAAIMTASIGAMAYVFSDYAVQLWELDPRWGVWLAAAAVAVLTVMNLLGVVMGKWTQNVLTALKVVGLSAIVVAGLAAGARWESPGAAWEVTGETGAGGFGLAMIFVLYAFGGWNDAAFVAAEVKQRERNIPKVLLLGTGSIAILYLVINTAYMYGLGFEGVRASGTPAADLLAAAWGSWGSRSMSMLVMISALGALNGLIFTGSRIYASMGQDHRMLRVLGRWNRRGVPVWSLLAQSAMALLLVLAVGTQTGRDTIDAALVKIRLPALPWDQYYGGFDTLVAGTAPVFWGFFLMTGMSLFILRDRDRETRRPFKVPLFPLVPLVFCLTCWNMLYAAIEYAKWLCLLGILPVALGLPVYLVSRLGRR